MYLDLKHTKTTIDNICAEMLRQHANEPATDQRLQLISNEVMREVHRHVAQCSLPEGIEPFAYPYVKLLIAEFMEKQRNG